MRLREAIWEAVRLRRNDFAAKEVRDLVAERGIRRTINAVNYHLEQFVEEGRVIRVPQPWPDVRKRVYRVRRAASVGGDTCTPCGPASAVGSARASHTRAANNDGNGHRD